MQCERAARGAALFRLQDGIIHRLEIQTISNGIPARNQSNLHAGAVQAIQIGSAFGHIPFYSLARAPHRKPGESEWSFLLKPISRRLLYMRQPAPVGTPSETSPKRDRITNQNRPRTRGIRHELPPTSELPISRFFPLWLARSLEIPSPPAHPPPRP